MPPTFLSEDFLFRYKEVIPPHLEQEINLMNHDAGLWCLVSINKARKNLHPLAINIENADVAYNLALARIYCLKDRGDKETELSVVGPNRFKNLIRSLLF